MTNHFDVFTPRVTEYENEENTKIHLIVEEPRWDSSTSEYSERETQILNDQGKNSIPATASRKPVYVSAVVSYSLANVATDVIDYDNLATALESQIQISIVLIDMVRKPSVEPIVLSKRWGITPEKTQKTIQATTQRGIRTMLHPSLSRQLRMNDRNLYYYCLAHPVFSDMMIASKCPEGATDVHKYMPQTLDGQELSQWHPEVKHMRPCSCCLLGMKSCQFLYATMPNR